MSLTDKFHQCLGLFALSSMGNEKHLTVVKTTTRSIFTQLSICAMRSLRKASAFLFLLFCRSLDSEMGLEQLREPFIGTVFFDDNHLVTVEFLVGSVVDGLASVRRFDRNL